MDVLVRTFCIGLIAVLAACGNDKSEMDAALKSNTGLCEAQEIQNQYIAKWKSGRVTHIQAASKKDLITSFIEPHREALDYVEPDIVIELPKPVVEQGLSIQMAADSNWQHIAMRSSYAWNKNLKGEGVIVAVVDSGVQANHPSLQNQLAINHREIPNNAIDDDGNGFVDDYYGYDFYTRSPVLRDLHGHGTHVAGTIAAEHDNDPTVPRGVAPKAKILSLNFMDSEGRGATSSAIAALRYARDRGAKIINASWGASDCSLALKQMIEDLDRAGILLVAAAGNNGLNIDYYPNYPAAFSTPNVLAVAASTARGLTANFSNYSINRVHVAAPGRDIFSSVPTNSFAFYSGTSMAAPQVSGLAAIIWSALPHLSVDEVKAAIMAGVEGQYYPVVTRGEVDVQKTLENLGL